MNILIINHNAGRPDLGMAFRPYYLAKEWIKLGHSVTIIGGTYSHIRKGTPAPGEEMYEGVKYIWIKTRKYNGNGFGRFFSMIQFVLSICIRANRIAKRINPELVIASSTYPLDIYPAHKISKISGAKLCFELHDLWPLSPLELGGYSRRHPFIRLMQMAEDYYCKYSDKVISMLPLTKEYLMSRGMDGRKFYHIPNGIAIEEWSDNTIISNELILNIGILKNNYDFLIAYAGAHGLANSLKVLVDVAYKLSNERVGIVLFGQGPEKEGLKTYVKNKNINNVYFFDPVPKNEIPLLLCQFDALYIGLQKESLFRFGISPNKIFDYMMAARPIIQAIDSGNNLVHEANCGVNAEAGDVDKILKAILYLKSLSNEERNSMGQNGKEFVLKNHTYSILANKFLAAISD